MPYGLDAVDGSCPTAEEARTFIVQEARIPVRLESMPCWIEEPTDVLSIAEPEAATAPSCCFESTCGEPLDAIARQNRYDATCAPPPGSTFTCENLATWTTLTAEGARARLAKDVPACTVRASNAQAVNVQAVHCRYTVRLRLHCDDGPG
jgi:hypothetical protein